MKELNKRIRSMIAWTKELCGVATKGEKPNPEADECRAGHYLG